MTLVVSQQLVGDKAIAFLSLVDELNPPGGSLARAESVNACWNTRLNLVRRSPVLKESRGSIWSKIRAHAIAVGFRGWSRQLPCRVCLMLSSCYCIRASCLNPYLMAWCSSLADKGISNGATVRSCAGSLHVCIDTKLLD